MKIFLLIITFFISKISIMKLKFSFKLIQRMSQSNQHSRIASLIQEIIDACKTDPTRLEVATVNFESLIKAMKLYEKADRYFKAIIDEADNSNKNIKLPVMEELQKIFGRKVKQQDLLKLATYLCTKTGLNISREMKRNKIFLIRWYEWNWETLYPLIHSMDISKIE